MNRQVPLFAAPVALLCFFLLPAQSANATTYTLTSLGLDTGSGEYSINDYGQVAAQHPGSGAFVWTPTAPNGTTGTKTNLGPGPDGAAILRVTGINNYGQVTGHQLMPPYGDEHRAYLWTPTTLHGTSGLMTALGDLPPDLGVVDAWGINDYGQVTGQRFATSEELHGFVWTPSAPNSTSGSMVDLGVVSSSDSLSHPVAINNSGQITGYTLYGGFLWSPSTPNGSSGSMVGLTDPGPGFSMEGLAINDPGQVAGFLRTTAGDVHAFIWTPSTPNGASGSIADLGSFLGGPTAAYGINNAGEVVGGDFLWTPGSGFLDLNTVIAAGGTGWTLTHAYDINNVGQIVGYGLYDPDGPGGISPYNQGFLLTPNVPEPISLPLAIVLLLIARRRW